jgi:hypothetical protein
MKRSPLAQSGLPMLLLGACMMLPGGIAMGADDPGGHFLPGDEFLMPAPCCGSRADGTGLSTGADVRTLWQTARNLLFPDRVRNNPSDMPESNDDWRWKFRANRRAIMITVGTQW